MDKRQHFTPKERARIIDIQDFLIERLVEHREAIENGQEARARQLEAEIEQLRCEKDSVGK